MKFGNRIRIFMLCTLAFIATKANAQDPLFSLFDATAMYFNPAHVGNVDYSRASLGYRNHYPSFNSAFVTYLAAGDTYIDAINSGIGVMVLRDDVAKGVFTNTSINLAYSYNLKLSENAYARGGIQLTYANRKRDPSGLIFPDTPDFGGNIINPNNYPIIKNSTLYVGLGATFMYKTFVAGVAVFNLGGKSLSESNYVKIPSPTKVTAYASMAISLEGSRRYPSDPEPVTTINPYIKYQRQYEFSDLDLGAYFNTNIFFIGGGARFDTDFKNTTFVVGAGFKFNYFNIGYSANFGDVGSGNRYVSAHEVNLTIKFGYKDHFSGGGVSKKQRNRVYKCPY